MEPLFVFERYNFANIDRSWIKSVWDSSFMNIEDVPTDYLIFLESQDVIELLKETSAVVKDWISQNDVEAETESNESSEAPTEVSWQTLLSFNLDVQALLAVLAYLIKKGQAFDANQESRQSCLKATSLYFVLLSIPGSNAFQAFHPTLYESALKTLNLSQRLTFPDVKTGKKSNLDFLDEDLSLDEEDFQIPRSLPKSQSIILTKGLNGVVFDLVTMFKSAATSLDIRLIETTVFNLVEMTKLANETMSDFSRARNSEASINSLAYNAYVALRFLCNPKYAAIPIVTRIIGKYVLPQLLISNNNKLAPKQMTIIRDSTIHFLKTLLEKHGRDAQETLATLIQHLMIKSPERLEGRQKQAVVVIKLMNICQGNVSVYKQSLKDLVLLSVHHKISCRIFAQEIIGKYLLDLSASQNSRQEENFAWTSSKTNRLLLAAALSRCVDSSSMVRGRAIATFAEYTDSIEKPEVREIFRVESEQEMTELPNLEELVGAIEENDTEKILPNFRGILAMLKKRIEDERAMVRRSSLQALRNGILVIPELLEEAAPIIGTHCRDAALSVRKFAIRVLTTIFEIYPENSSLCRHWVDSVVPRVYDSETKVQEEVLSCLEKLTTGKIAKTGSQSKNTSAADLPWRILRELARNKMGDHLARACSIWVNSGTISSAAIANIKSHIGSENNLEAWLLLASLAENTPLGNMANYYSYFEKALKDDSPGNGFFSSLVLQVLRHSWPSFDDQSLTKIQNDMLKYLKLFKVRVTLISHCLDILHGIGIFRGLEMPLGTDGEAETMRDLMRLSEATIARLVEPEDGENDDEDAGKILIRATCTLGHASFFSTEKISVKSLRILQGFLLEWNILPSSVKATKELQGVAVAVLGQQALRDLEIAQEMTPIFGRLLRNTGRNSKNSNMANGSAVRINTAKALADICVRFTRLVEPYLPDMCISMKDPNPKVRQVILVIFIQLLAEDFIRINGPFFFHILSMLSDSDSTIRQMTVFLVKERLISKNKSLVTQQFINCIFHFNDYERHYERNSLSKRRAKELKALTIPGEKGAEERRVIYDFMLEHLDPPGKLKILNVLTQLILKSTCKKCRSGLGELDVSTEKGICIFRDTLYVLTSEYLQPNSITKQNIDEDNLEDVATPAPTPTAANSVIVEAMKKLRLQIFLPGLVKLKKRFAAANSTLVGDVAKVIASLLSDYNKDQLENLYKKYPDLEKEIERDIREFDEEDRIPEDESLETVLVSSTPKKTKFDGSLIVNPDWMPRIVLRRISTLTYPENTLSNSESGSKSAKGPQSPRVVLRRLDEQTQPEISQSKDTATLDLNSTNDSRGKEKASSPSTSGRSAPRRTRSSSTRD